MGRGDFYLALVSRTNTPPDTQALALAHTHSLEVRNILEVSL